MNPRYRRAWLFFALAGVLGWSAWLAFEEENAVVDPEVTVAVKRASPARVAVPAGPAEPLPRLALAESNLFPEQTWFVPPPPPPPAPPPPPPPPPQAPPLPFSYMGRWQEGGETTYYLARGPAAAVAVRPGQTVDGVWRLEPVAGNVLKFTYLPLNQTRSLRAGD